MTTKEELLALADRVEAATGADRELDRDIILAAVPCDRAPFRYWVPMNENTGHGAEDVERVYYGPHCAQAIAVPMFTASLDAAMSLVPAGYDWAVFHANGGLTVHAWCGSRDGIFGATPALALTAAALRAHAALTKEP